MFNIEKKKKNVSHVIIVVHANLAWIDIWEYTPVKKLSSVNYVIIIVHTNLPWTNMENMKLHTGEKTFEIWLMWLSLFNISAYETTNGWKTF